MDNDDDAKCRLYILKKADKGSFHFIRRISMTITRQFFFSLQFSNSETVQFRRFRILLSIRFIPNGSIPLDTDSIQFDSVFEQHNLLLIFSFVATQISNCGALVEGPKIEGKVKHT
jgi:hypothetical protein